MVILNSIGWTMKINQNTCHYISFYWWSIAITFPFYSFYWLMFSIDSICEAILALGVASLLIIWMIVLVCYWIHHTLFSLPVLNTHVFGDGYIKIIPKCSNIILLLESVLVIVSISIYVSLVSWHMHRKHALTP